MRSAPLKAVCGLAAAVALTGSALAADWPQWRGPQRDGISREDGWLAEWPEGGPKRLWQRSVGRGLATVAVSRGRLYTLGHHEGRETTWCLDAATGAVVWKHSEAGGRSFNYPGSAATPTADGERLYAHGREGALWCFEAGSGKVLWRRNLRQDFGFAGQNPDYGNSCSPLVVGRLLIVEVGAPDALLVALDKTDGKLVWKGANGGQLAYSSPVAFERDGKQLIAAFHAFGLGVFDAADGKELWRHPWKTYDWCSVATPIVAGERIFISASYGRGGALLQFGRPTPLWQSKEMMSHHATCVLWEGHLYGFHYDRKRAPTLRCLDFGTGEVKWAHGGLGNGTALLADGKLIILGQRGELVVAEASPDGFEPTARAKVLDGLCWTVPVLSGGRLYCRNHPGNLVCLDLREAQPRAAK